MTTCETVSVGTWVRRRDGRAYGVAAIDGTTAHLIDLCGQPAGSVGLAELATLPAANVMVIPAKPCCGELYGEGCACGEIARAPEFTIHQ